jgi:hypothetical protein
MLQEMKQTARRVEDGLGAAAVEALSAALAARDFRSKVPEAEGRQVLLKHFPEAAACISCGEDLHRMGQEGSSRRSPAGGNQGESVVLSLVRQSLLIRDEQHGVPMLRLSLPGAGSVV